MLTTRVVRRRVIIQVNKHDAAVQPQRSDAGLVGSRGLVLLCVFSKLECLERIYNCVQNFTHSGFKIDCRYGGVWSYLGGLYDMLLDILSLMQITC